LSKEVFLPFNPRTVSAAGPRDSLSVWPRAAGTVLAGSALVAVCAHLALPLYFTPVPLSMAPFAVLLLGLVLSPRLAAATLFAYLAEGAIGLPVFSPGPIATGGLAHLVGPTGGYLVAYPFAAALVSLLRRRGGRGFTAALIAAATGDLTILAGGALWLAVIAHSAAQQVFALAVLPFLPGDALKIALAAALSIAHQRLRRRAG
jgi:biotin transport system substrate-specific component